MLSPMARGRRHDYEPLLGCFGDWIGRMQYTKWLQHYQFLDGRYLITMDGSQYFSSYKVNCECCLTPGPTSLSRRK